MKVDTFRIRFGYDIRGFLTDSLVNFAVLGIVYLVVMAIAFPAWLPLGGRSVALTVLAPCGVLMSLSLWLAAPVLVKERNAPTE